MQINTEMHDNIVMHDRKGKYWATGTGGVERNYEGLTSYIVVKKLKRQWMDNIKQQTGVGWLATAEEKWKG